MMKFGEKPTVLITCYDLVLLMYRNCGSGNDPIEDNTSYLIATG